MVVKVYISGISGNKEVKKRQQRVLMILDSKSIKYDVIDITEPGREVDKDFMQSNSKSNGGTVSDPNPRSPLPPQLFNDDEYCGDYDQFDLANEVDTLEQFLKLEVPPEEPPQVDSEKEKIVNGDLDGKQENKEENSDVKEETETTEKTEEPTNDKEKSPVKEQSPTKEESLPQDANDSGERDTKEKSPDQETEKQPSVEKEGTLNKAQSPEKDVEKKLVSKENTPEKEMSINENGTVSSRELSEEKSVSEGEQIDVVEQKTDNTSEALIQSEQAAAAE